MAFQVGERGRADEGETHHRSRVSGLGGSLFQCQAGGDSVESNIDNRELDFNVDNGASDFNINNRELDGAKHDSRVEQGFSAIPGGRERR